jgi:predicted transcriptional regulator YheO
MNPLLKNYFPVADIIAGTFGPGCEVAVHDLEQPDRSVVYVAGSVTGRKAGQSFDHLVKNVLLNEQFKDDRAINYTFEANGKRSARRRR